MKPTIALLFGGKSVEHEISVISALQALQNFDEEKYQIIPLYLTKNNEMYFGSEIGDIEKYKDIDALLKRSQRVIMLNSGSRVHVLSYPAKKFKKNVDIELDLAFPVVHGTNVEDGTIQGYLKTLGLPFVGCDVMASALGMDKYLMKGVLKDNNIPVLDGQVFTLSDYENLDGILDKVEQDIEYPAIVKPVNLGSSVGIQIAKNRSELSLAVDDAFKYAPRILVEHAIEHLREINCAVLGDENSAMASVCEEPLHSKDILSYEDKYVNNAKASNTKGMASVSRKIPASIPDDLKERIQDIAVRAFKVFGCNGVARIDFMIDEDNDSLYFNEINTIPGSLSFYLWEPMGISYQELLDRMIELALQRARTEEALCFSFDTNILSCASFKGSKGGKV